MPQATLSRVSVEARPAASPATPRAGKVDAYCIGLIVMSCVLLYFLGLGSWGLIDPGDGYFTEAAREMLERGDLVTPYLNYQIYFSKPILIFWLIISAFQTFGVNEFACRFWSALSATGVAVLAYWTVRSVTNRRAAITASLVAASAPLVVTFARMALIDMLFSSLLVIAVCATVMTLAAGSNRWWPVIWVALGLAVLAKGPAAVVLFVPSLVAYWLMRGADVAQMKDDLKRLHILPGTLIAALISVPWYIAVGLATDGLWPKVFIFFENFGRFSGQTNHRNTSPFFYLPVLAYGLFPWVLFLPPALSAVAKSVRQKWTTRVEPDATGKAELMLAAWSLVVLAAFTASQTKLQTYILPVFPTLGMLIGIWLDRALPIQPGQPVSKYMKFAGAALMVFGALFTVASATLFAVCVSPEILAKLPAKVQPTISSLLMHVPPPTISTAFATAAFVGYLLVRQQQLLSKGLTDKSWRVLMVATIIGSAFGSIVAFNIGYELRQGALHRIAAYLKDKPGRIATFHDFKPTLMFYLQRPVDSFFMTERMIPLPPGSEPQYIIVGSKEKELFLSARADVVVPVCEQDGWTLYRSDKMAVHSLPTLEETFKNNINLSTETHSYGTLPFGAGTKPERAQ